MFSPHPIQTHYKGCRFRSRLEARWAVVFDHLGLKWEYEKEGYHLASGNYLPDFWLPVAELRKRIDPSWEWPDAGFFVEIKPIEPSQHEIELLADLSKTTGHTCILVFGSIGDHSIYYASRTCVYSSPRKHTWWPTFITGIFHAKAIEEAFVAGRSARFEFGEKG